MFSQFPLATGFAQLSIMCVEKEEQVLQGAVWCKISLTPVKVSIFTASQDCNGIYENILLLHFNIYGFAFHVWDLKPHYKATMKCETFRRLIFVLKAL